MTTNTDTISSKDAFIDSVNALMVMGSTITNISINTPAINNRGVTFIFEKDGESFSLSLEEIRFQTGTMFFMGFNIIS